MKHFGTEKNFQKYKPCFTARPKRWRVFGNKEKKEVKLKIWFWIKIIALIIFAGVWVWYLAYSPFFRINSIGWYNLKDISKQEIEQKIDTEYFNKWSLLPNNNYFFLNANKIKKIINESYSVDGIEVRKIFPNKLEIEITERPAALVYDNGRKYYLLDSEGNIIKELYEVEQREYFSGAENIDAPYAEFLNADFSFTEASSSIADTPKIKTEHIPNYRKIKLMFNGYPLIYDARGLEINDKEKNILSPVLIQSLTYWQAEAVKQGIGNPLFFVVKEPLNGVALKTTNSWYLFFDPFSDNIKQMENLKTILNKNKPTSYVNVRFMERVFWK